jgi:PAS domain S-box-containing protein
VLADIAAISADAIICVDADQVIRFFNEGAQQIFGWTADEAVGQSLDILLPERVREIHRTHMERFAKSGVRARRMGERQEISGLRKNGEEFPAEAAIAKVGEGRDVMFSVAMRDITEQVELYKRLQRAVTARDETVGVVAHDLRNPVSAIKMLAMSLHSTAKARGVGPNETEQLKLIREAAQQMDRLIQDLLDVTRAESGRLVVTPQPLTTKALLEGALQTLRPLAEDAGLALALDVPSTLPQIQADPERISQVLSNLVGNAIKFTPRGGAITVRAVELPDAVRISVTDTGVGISKDHLPNVFDRFWQQHPSSIRTRGAGLGLPIAQAIVHAHGGRMWAESEFGAGSTFHFTLPIEAP